MVNVPRSVSIDNQETEDQKLWRQLPQTEGEERAALFIDLAKHAIYRSANDEALVFLEQAQDIYKNLGSCASRMAMANTISGIGYSLKEMNQIEAATEALDKAIEILRSADYPFLADSLRTRGSWLGEAGKWQAALESYSEAAQINEINGVQEFLARDLLHVANCYFELGDWNRVIETALRARTIFKELRMLGELSWCDLNIAKAHVERKEADQALLWSQRALDVGSLRKDNEMICKSSLVIARSHILVGDFPKAEGLLLEAQDIVSNSSDWSQMIKIEEALIEVFLATNRDVDAGNARRRLCTLKELVLKDEAVVTEGDQDVA